jgi:hypothetical protein
VDVAKLAREQSINRVVMGVGLIALPQVFAQPWMGPSASDVRSRVIARALGARDLALGCGALTALREQDRTWAARCLAAHAGADAIDLLAILAAGRALPRFARLGGGALAALSAAVAAAYARELRSPAG